MTREHPYVVAPYSGIVSPLIEMEDCATTKVSRALGFTTLIDSSAREQLSAAMESYGDKYISWIWAQRPKPAKSNKHWQPYHHADAAPPLHQQAVKASTVMQLPVKAARPATPR